MRHKVRILSFSVSLGTDLGEIEEEMASLLDDGFEIAAATGYTVGQGGPHHGGAFIVLVKRGTGDEENDVA